MVRAAMEATMGSFSIWHLLILGIVVMLFFGKGRFSDLMGDVAKGIKSFKKGMADEDDPSPPPPPTRIEGRTATDAPIDARDRDRTL
jgi:sec-independent protein translocase protein TatA